MPAQFGLYFIRRRGLPLALAGSILTIATSWLAVPAAAQFRMGPGGFGMGMGTGMMSPPVQQYAPPPPPPSSSAEHKSHKVKTARRSGAAHEGHAKEAPADVPAKSDSNSSGAF